MSNREVTSIVTDLQRMRPNSDFTQIGEQIRDLQQRDPQHFQRNLQRINDSVNMRDLGFPSDFRIAGVNAQGRMVTVSEDGRTVEQRDMRNMGRAENPTAAPAAERIGGREVQVDPVDGTRTYTSRRGDSTWSIARDSLRGPNGERPTEAQVAERVQAIARENGMADPGRLMQGTELRIPRNDDPRAAARGDRQQGPFGPNLPADSPELRPRDNTSNLLAPPGLAGDRRDDPMVRNRVQGLVERRENGSTITNYTGQLRDGYFTDTNFTARQTTDQSGRIVHNRVTYDSDGPAITFRTPNGPQRIDHVRSVESTFNARTGRYDTTVTAADGQRYVGVTTRDGRPFTYVADPPRP